MDLVKTKDGLGPDKKIFGPESGHARSSLMFELDNKERLSGISYQRIENSILYLSTICSRYMVLLSRLHKGLEITAGDIFQVFSQKHYFQS